MPSNHLILCHPLLLWPSTLPRIRVFSSESVLCIKWPKYWSFSFSLSPSNEYSGLISFRIDWFDLRTVQGTLKSLLQHHSSKASVLEALSALDFFDYQRDFLERTVLFWDTLRQRANNMLEHERAGLPPLLDFKHETLLDARRFERPVNYALLRITEIDTHCWDDCVDPDKPPVIVVDPRAGHGPGIGGFKRDSEVGMAMREGHPVYFVIFFPEPTLGQTLADVLHVLRRFVEEVALRHPGKPPVLYGNCQAGRSEEHTSELQSPLNLVCR